jgi:hypothetical protein
VEMTIDLSGCQAVLLDCCSLLNLYASRRMAEILQVLPVRCAVAEAVISEAAYVLRGGDGEDAAEREPLDLQPFTAFGRIEVWRLETEAEFTSFVGLAAEIDDGEAATCALCFHRAGAVVTDDRKTHRVMARSASQIPVVTTSQLLKCWAEATHAEEVVLRTMLLDIQTRARFVPGKQDPLLAWWEALIRPSTTGR